MRNRMASPGPVFATAHRSVSDPRFLNSNLPPSNACSLRFTLIPINRFAPVSECQES